MKQLIWFILKYTTSGYFDLLFWTLKTFPNKIKYLTFFFKSVGSKVHQTTNLIHTIKDRAHQPIMLMEKTNSVLSVAWTRAFAVVYNKTWHIQLCYSFYVVIMGKH